MADWIRRFIGVAETVAQWSKDSTKVGAVLVGPEREIRLTAFNGPPMGVVDSPDRFERPRKYLYASHAEQNLIAFAAREGIRTAGCAVYVTHPPCAACARLMIQAGVKKVIVGNGRLVGAHFIEENQAAALMFDEAGVKREVAP